MTLMHMPEAVGAAPILKEMALDLTSLGSLSILFFVMSVSALSLFFRGNPQGAWHLIVAAASSVALEAIAGGLSFAVAAIYLTIAILLSRGFSQPFQRRVILSLFLALVLLLGLSRIYLRAEYLPGVAVGTLLGIGWAVAVGYCGPFGRTQFLNAPRERERLRWRLR